MNFSQEVKHCSRGIGSCRSSTHIGVRTGFARTHESPQKYDRDRDVVCGKATKAYSGFPMLVQYMIYEHRP